MLHSILRQLAIGTAALAAVLAMVVGQAARGDEPLPTDPGLGAPAVKLREFVIPRGWPTPSCHASTIVETGPGELVAAWFGGTDEGEKDVAIWVARHDPAGWSEPRIVIEGTQADGSRHPCWNPVLFVGSALASQGNPAAPLFLYAKVGPSPSTWWGVVRESTDGGRSWGELRRLEGDAVGPVKNKPLVRRDGSVIAGASSEDDGWRVHFETSIDGGRTFARGPAVHAAPDTKGSGGTVGLVSAIQPSLLELGGEKLLAVGRTKEGRIFEIESSDAGKTWGELRLGTLPNPNAGTDAVSLADGRHLLVYNHTDKGRSPLNVAISRDGRSWQPVVALETKPGEFSYPAVIQSADGLVHITYTWNREAIARVILDPAKLP
ncbi:MAG: exo-alpha-sialidase [Planctomycetota bacterium]|nr:exo-alpha-sialidase [Planctomycetota bacterium]